MSSALGGQRTLEIHHHFLWDAESDAMTAVLDGYTDRNSDITISEEKTSINSLRLMIKSRILKEDPPDVWDEWPGANLEPTVDAGATADITDVWERTDMADAYFEGMCEAACFDGSYHAIPLDMYRISNLYYNIDQFEAVGVDPSRLSGPDELVDAFAQLGDVAANPFAVFGRNPYGPLQLWETLLLAHTDPSAYETVIGGDPSAQRDGIQRAFATLGDCLAVGPENPEFMDSNAVDESFSDGRTACLNNGTWTTGALSVTDNWEFGRDWECVPFPGTDGAHIVNTNSLVPAAHTEGDETVADFLEYAGSAETIEQFNAINGSVPPRRDVSAAQLHPLSRRLHDSFDGPAHQLPSMCHGLGVRPEQVVELKDAAATFLQDRDVTAATDTVVDSLSD